MSQPPGRQPPTPADCIRAARSVRTSSGGSAALDTVRPRTAGRLLRERGPLILQLYSASREGRLVWLGPDGFAMLEPPSIAIPGASTHRPQPGLRTLDRHWGRLRFAAPAVMAMLIAVGLALTPAPRLAAALCLLAGLTYTVILMVGILASQLLGRRPVAELELGSISGRHWSMPLFHQLDERHIDELLDQVQHTLHRKIHGTARQVGVDIGAQADGPSRLTETLICLHGGVTTSAALSRLEARTARSNATFSSESGFSLLFFDARDDDPARQPTKPTPFLRFYLGAVGVLILGLALLIMNADRQQCSTNGCGSPTGSYIQALNWLLRQVFWRDWPSASADLSHRTFAILARSLLPATVAVALAASYHHLAFRKKFAMWIAGQQHQEARTRVLIVTVTPTERKAMLGVIEEYLGRPLVPRYDGQVPVFTAGRPINGTDVFVVQAGAQGLNAPSGTPNVTAAAIRRIDPQYAIIAGICYGLDPDEQQLGDILVSDRTKDLDHAKLADLNGLVERQDRGEDVAPSPILLNACQAAEHSWSAVSPIPIQFGKMLAWNKLLNTEVVIEELRRRYPQAIGGDMEGAGFHAVTRVAGVESILIKAICDWGFGKTSDHQAAAAFNSASFVFHLITSGALMHAPVARRN